MNQLILTSLIFAFLIIAYHHIGYPLLLKLILRLPNKNTFDAYKQQAINLYKFGSASKTYTSNLPSITIIIPAYNEQFYIKDKIINLASIDYPEHKLKIIVACDGCTDETVLRAKNSITDFCLKNVEIVDFKSNRGKCAVINDIASKVTTDIIAFSDTSALISIDALSICAHRFREPSIGGINGNYILYKQGNTGEECYWNYQRNLKLGEEAMGSVLGAHGAFYAIRTQLFKKLPVNAINDDFIIPMRVIEQGFRVVYDSRINAIEMESTSNKQNWQRRKRIGYGNTQQLIILKNLLHPKFRGVALSFFSGKALRVSMPFIMIYTLFVSAYCSLIWPYLTILLLSQVLLYSTALIVEIFNNRNLGKVANTIHYLMVGHTANFCGTFNYLTRTKTDW